VLKAKDVTMKNLVFTVMVAILFTAVAVTLAGCKLSRITVEEVKERIDEGEPILFIDTRRSQDWEASDVKLPGALRIHYSELEQYLDELPNDRLIVPYCT